jgi:hypothetical protein
MIDTVFNLLFGCRHRRITRPITPAHKPGDPRGLARIDPAAGAHALP